MENSSKKIEESNHNAVIEALILSEALGNFDSQTAANKLRVS